MASLRSSSPWWSCPVFWQPVHAVMNAGTSRGAIAGAISLVTFPWLALVLTALFGRNKFNGYVLLRSSQDLDIRHFINKIQAEAVANELIREDLSKPCCIAIRPVVFAELCL